MRRIAGADSVAVFEDLGIQQAPNSTLCSYLNKLLWILTGNFAKRGGQHLHSSFAPLFTFGGVGRITGHGRTGDLRPGAVQRCAAGDPDRSSRPVPGDDRREQQPGALDRRLRGLPGGVRVPGADGGHRCRDDGDGPARPLCACRRRASSRSRRRRSSIWSSRTTHFICATRSSSRCRARCPSRRSGRGWCVRSVSSTTPTSQPLREAADKGLEAYAQAFLGAVSANPAMARVLPFVLYETLGPTLPEATQGCRGAVGAGAEDGDDLSRSGAARRPRRRQRALRGDPAEPLGCDVHRARVRGRLRADRPRRSQDRAWRCPKCSTRYADCATHRPR